MVRWLRITIIAGTILALMALGTGVGLLLVANDRWEVVAVHPWLAEFIGTTVHEAWLPAIMLGWLVAIFLLGVLLVGSMRYVWRRRQYEILIERIERELVELRNLPLSDPAPFEDVLERPSADALMRLEKASQGLFRLSAASEEPDR